MDKKYIDINSVDPKDLNNFDMITTINFINSNKHYLLDKPSIINNLKKKNIIKNIYDFDIENKNIIFDPHVNYND
jgi:hypothetical protein